MSDIISCNCPELATWHPGRIKHKLQCPIFRKLNPNLTITEFMEREGFPGEGPEKWPEIFMENVKDESC